MKPTTPKLPAPLTHTAIEPWPPRLPYDIALNLYSEEELLEAHDLTPEQFTVLRGTPSFRKAVREAIEDIKTNGTGFKAKAKIQAEELLSRSWALIHASNDDVPASVQADLIKWTAKVAGFEPKGDAPTGNIGGISININLGAAHQPLTINTTPTITDASDE